MRKLLMSWIKLKTPNNPVYINISLLAQIEFVQTRGELWLWFSGSNEPTKIISGAKSAYEQILLAIDNECGTNFKNVIEVNVK